MSATCSDLFCGAGGSSLGALMAGVEPVLGLNHWDKAIETHGTNFPNARHDQQDISSLTTAQIKSYPATDFLLASPECTNHSIAKGGKRVVAQSASLFDDGPSTSAEQDRSRATMWDVPRFAEAKIIQGRPYKFIIVENVADAYKWGENDNGLLFQSWLMSMRALGYESELVWLNSMFVPPTPQSRDRLYVVFWRKGIRAPNLKVEPICWCPWCETVVRGRQAWKKPAHPLHKPDGSPVGAKYGKQYLYICPDCHKTVIPGASPAGTAIDFTLPAQRIGSRDKPLATATIERIRRGLHKLGAEPFALRLLHGDNFKPATLPLFTLSQRQDVAMVFPVAGNTFERTPGNRARDANISPMDTLHGTLDKGMVLPAIAELQNHGGLKPMTDALHTLRAGGFHHGVVVANYGTSGTSKDGWCRAADEQPFGSITATDSHSLVVPYDRTGNAVETDTKSCPTLTQVERMALVGSNMANNGLESAHLHPAGTATTGNKLYLAVPPKDVLGVEHDWTDEEINDCRFRMFDLAEIARTMVMDQHADGEQYVVVGNKRERMAQYGNAVTPPVMRLLVGRALDAMDEAGGGRVAA